VTFMEAVMALLLVRFFYRLTKKLVARVRARFGGPGRPAAMPVQPQSSGAAGE